MRGPVFAISTMVGIALAQSPAAHAADPVRGKVLYEVTNGAPLACANSGCHGTNVSLNKNKIRNGANNGPLIMSAISKNTGGMGFLSAYVNSTDAADIGAYIANPAAGTGAPAASVLPSSLAFAATVVGAASANQAVTVANTGTAALSIASIATSGANAAEFGIVAGGSCAAGSSVAAGGSCSILLRFQPAAPGTRTATLTIAHNATGGSSSAALSGTATVVPQPTISVSSNAASFASTALGTTSPVQTITVVNVGGASLTFTGFVVSGAQAAEFTRPAGAAGGTCASGTALAPGASCTVGIAFSPSALGTRSATLTIASDAANGSPAIALSGTGAPAPAPIAQLTPAAQAFGDQTIGTTSPARRAVLANIGSASMSISGIAITGSAAFAIAVDNCGATLAAGASCTIDVTFTPALAGAASAALQVADSAAGSLHAVSLGGNGVVGPVGSPTLAPTALVDFGDVQLGQRSAPRQFMLGNGGGASYAISTIAIAGTDASSFAIEAGDCAAGQSIAPAASCTVSVSFAPAAIGAKAARLEIAASSGSQLSVDLRGTGLAVAAAAIDTGAGMLDFGVQPLNGTATQTLTVTNSGTATLQVSEIDVTGPFTIDATSSQCPAVPFTLDPGASCQLVVTFNATVAGKQSGQVSIASNAGPTPKSVVLAATADAAPRAGPQNLGGGGCTSDPGGRGDPVLPLLALAAPAALAIRRRAPVRPTPIVKSETGEQR
ncbi:MAG: choice-of-anchor D domain-containing protein [Burkholderiaceae bacterium]|nr:choice-of-anchor D domain-containing protein [Burkholderiaceae bacterium]